MKLYERFAKQERARCEALEMCNNWVLGLVAVVVFLLYGALFLKR